MIFKIKDSDSEIEVTVSLKEVDNSVRIVARCPGEFANTIGSLKDGKLFLYKLQAEFIKMSGIITDDKGYILIDNIWGKGII